MPMILLHSADNEIFEVDRDVIRPSITLSAMFQDLELDKPEAVESLNAPVKLANVSAVILRKVIRNNPVAQIGNRTNEIPAWDMQFLSVDQGTLFELVRAANYLDVRGLLDVSCKMVAHMIKDKTPDEIRQKFGIEDDLPAEEKDQIRKENAWSVD
ncbi:s-phase kinase associated protein [Aphelenchoides avenae]|nr:s-phase kinase associated protein [Aphelenchus avenae]KAH7709379.1 s-phase kinase associated protein [Aphelenchus avenae]